MFQGRIKGIGPRYCPSIEDKINRFAERERHQIFVEPEGWNTIEIYVNGFSTSLPEDVQYRALRKIPGFENAKMFRPGYAIEYDFFPPTQLKLTLETNSLKICTLRVKSMAQPDMKRLHAGLNGWNKCPQQST